MYLGKYTNILCLVYLCKNLAQIYVQITSWLRYFLLFLHLGNMKNLCPKPKSTFTVDENE